MKTVSVWCSRGGLSIIAFFTLLHLSILPVFGEDEPRSSKKAKDGLEITGTLKGKEVVLTITNNSPNDVTVCVSEYVWNYWIISRGKLIEEIDLTKCSLVEESFNPREKVPYVPKQFVVLKKGETTPLVSKNLPFWSEKKDAAQNVDDKIFTGKLFAEYNVHGNFVDANVEKIKVPCWVGRIGPVELGDVFAVPIVIPTK